ncbi:MAG: DUF177 domain-containing protein [Acidobacteria bacterium]|nr:DUF177 domain-containing protein [Acidobacteriota bacterium]
MFLDIHELEHHKIFFDQSLGPGRIDLGEDIWQVELLEIHGSAELMATEIHLRGSFRTVVELCCARCLERTRRPLEMEFDLFYRPIQTIARAEEIEVRREDLDIGFYHGDGLLLEDAIKEQILLSLPMKTVCRPDCAGLCPRCGQNRNITRCGCEALPLDPRWAPLTKLKGET